MYTVLDHSVAIAALKDSITQLDSDVKLLRQREKDSLAEATRYRNAALPLETQISALKAAIVQLGGMP